MFTPTAEDSTVTAALGRSWCGSPIWQSGMLRCVTPGSYGIRGPTHKERHNHDLKAESEGKKSLFSPIEILTCDRQPSNGETGRPLPFPPLQSSPPVTPGPQTTTSTANASITTSATNADYQQFPFLLYQTYHHEPSHGCSQLSTTTT